jgi:hypothetical protein
MMVDNIPEIRSNVIFPLFLSKDNFLIADSLKMVGVFMMFYDTFYCIYEVIFLILFEVINVLNEESQLEISLKQISKYLSKLPLTPDITYVITSFYSWVLLLIVFVYRFKAHLCGNVIR